MDIGTKITATKFVYDRDYAITGEVVEVDGDGVAIKGKSDGKVDYYRIFNGYEDKYRILSDEEYEFVDKLTSAYFAKIANAYNKKYKSDLAPSVIEAFIMRHWYNQSIDWLIGLTPLKIANRLKDFGMEELRGELGPA